MNSLVKEFTKGFWKEIPPFRLVLGLCPTLAVTKSMLNGFGMGIAVVFVLVLSNMLISAVRKTIPGKVRIACFIVIAATVVVTVELLLKAYAFSLSESLGIFVPLIVVNCIILGRAEAFASKNGVLASMMDGFGIGLGYTISLTSLGALREIFGTGMLFSGSKELIGYDLMFQVFGPDFKPFKFLVEAPGAFICLGVLLGVMNFIGMIEKKRKPAIEQSWIEE